MTRIKFRSIDADDRPVTGDLIGEPTPTGLGGEYETQERSLTDPLLSFRSRSLIGTSLSVVLTGDVYGQTRWLRRYARGNEGDDRAYPLHMIINAGGAWDLDEVRHPSWRWVIRDVVPQADEEYLAYGPKGKERQLVIVEVSRAQTADPIFRRAGRPLTQTAAVKATTRATAKDVKYGLVFVSVRVYGTASRVADIMRLNKITDPKKLKKGQVIKLP